MEPNITIIVGDMLDTIPINPTFNAQLLGNTSGKTINLESDADNQATANGIQDGATVQFTGDSDDFTFVRNGTKVEVQDGDNNVVAEVNGGGTGSTLKFADGSTTITLDGAAQSVSVGDQELADNGDSVDGGTTDVITDADDVSGIGPDQPPAPTGPTFSVSAGSTTVDEGTPAEDGSTTDGNEVTLTVTRSGVTDGQATVAVQSTDGSAQGGSDFDAVSETVTFADGETEQTVTLTTIPDDVREPDEGLTVSLGSPSTGSVSADNGSVEITIANDDENQLPVITAPSETNAFIGDDTGVSGISFTDKDDNTGFTVTVSAEGSSEVSFDGSGSLNATAVDAAGNSISLNETANTIVLSGTETAINDDLENLEFVTNSTTPGTETLSIEVEDTVGGTASQDVTVNVGQQENFTNENDDDLMGTSGADIFNADQTSAQVLQSGDQADGDNGPDTLAVTSDVSNGQISALDTDAISGIQTVDITFRSNGTGDGEQIDFNDFSGDLQNVRVTTADAGGDADSGDTLTAQNVTSGATFAFTNDAGDFTISQIANAASSDAVTVNLGGGAKLSDIEDSNNEIDTLTINSTGSSANEVIDLAGDATLAADANINIGGGADFTIDLGTGDLATVDGNTADGALDIDGSGVASGNDALKIIGGSGGDDLTGSNNEGTTLTGNGGDDTLIGGAGANVDTLTGGAGADDLTGGGGNDTFVFAEGDGGSASDARDEITDLAENDKLDVTDFGDFGLSDGDTLGTSASDASSAEIFIDRTNNRIVIETSADGSTTEEIDISEVAAESAFTFKDNGTPNNASDDFIEVGAAPLTPTNDNTGTLTVVGKVSGGGNTTITVDDGQAPTVGGSTVGSAAVTTIDVSEITNNGANIVTSGANVDTTPTTSLTITGSQQGDVIAGGTADDGIDFGNDAAADTFVFNLNTDGGSTAGINLSAQDVDSFSNVDEAGAGDAEDVFRFDVNGSGSGFDGSANNIGDGNASIDAGEVEILTSAVADADAATLDGETTDGGTANDSVIKVGYSTADDLAVIWFDTDAGASGGAGEVTILGTFDSLAGSDLTGAGDLAGLSNNNFDFIM